MLALYAFYIYHAQLQKTNQALVTDDFTRKKYIYQFKNVKVTTAEPPLELFNRCGYSKAEVKTAPIASVVRDKIMDVVKRF